MPTSQLDPLTLGVVLAVLGMGGTLATLFALSLVMDLLKRLFPAESAAGSGDGGRGSGQGSGDGGQGSGQPSQVGAQPAAGTPNPQPPTPNPPTAAP